MEITKWNYAQEEPMVVCPDVSWLHVYPIKQHDRVGFGMDFDVGVREHTVSKTVLAGTTSMARCSLLRTALEIGVL